MRFTLLLLAGLVLAAPARAEMTAEADPMPFPIQPLAQTGTSEVRVRGAPCGEDVTFSVDNAAPWMHVLLDPDPLPSPACEGTWDAEATLQVRVEPDAPAMEGWPLVVRAHAGPQNASFTVDVRAAFTGILDVEANRTEATVEPQRAASFEVVVTNRGNGNAKVTFNLVHGPPALTVPTPNSITLQPGQRVTVPIVAQTRGQTGYVNQVDVFTVSLASAHALHPDQKGDTETLSFTVRTQGAYVPGPAAWVALAAAALVLNRRLGKP